MPEIPFKWAFWGSMVCGAIGLAAMFGAIALLLRWAERRMRERRGDDGEE